MGHLSLRSLPDFKIGSFFIFSADDSKKSVTVWAKFLSTLERCYLAPSENIMDYWNFSYH